MKKQSNGLKSEVSELLERVTLEEAHDSVLTKFESAFSGLDAKSQEVLQAYFEGCSLEELSERHSITVGQTKDWILQIKRQLIAQLQRNISARH